MEGLPNSPSEISERFGEEIAKSFWLHYNRALNGRHIPGYTVALTKAQFIKRFARRLGRNQAERDGIECICWSEVEGFNQSG